MTARTSADSRAPARVDTRTDHGRPRGQTPAATRREGPTTSTTPAPLLYTIPEAARALRISRTKLYELLDTDQIESVHIGRSRKIPADALHAYVHRLRHEQEE